MWGPVTGLVAPSIDIDIDIGVDATPCLLKLGTEGSSLAPKTEAQHCREIRGVGERKNANLLTQPAPPVDPKMNEPGFFRHLKKKKKKGKVCSKEAEESRGVKRSQEESRERGSSRDS